MLYYDHAAMLCGAYNTGPPKCNSSKYVQRTPPMLLHAPLHLTNSADDISHKGNFVLFPLDLLFQERMLQRLFCTNPLAWVQLEASIQKVNCQLLICR